MTRVGMKPMLAGKAPAKVVLPAMASPKLDGIRCLIVKGQALSRSFKPIPNACVSRVLSGVPHGLDGELVVGEPTGEDVIRRTTSGVMAHNGKPDFTFWVFDDFSAKGGFDKRFERLAKSNLERYDFIRIVPHTLITSHEQLDEYEAAALESGYEGVMIRSLDGPYKWGRSSTKEGFLLKLKRFEDSEAVIIGVEELKRNRNEAKRNALGRLERSSAKSGKVNGGCLGACLVRDIYSGEEFSLGGGFTQKEREQLWKIKERLPGMIVRYKRFPTGSKNAPRFPVYQGFRSPIDL